MNETVGDGAGERERRSCASRERSRGKKPHAALSVPLVDRWMRCEQQQPNPFVLIAESQRIFPLFFI